MRIIPRAERRAQRRTHRATLRTRVRTHRATARIHRHGHGTLATHCIAAGLPTRQAATVAGTLRKNAAKAGIAGTPGISYRKGRTVRCVRYSRTQVAQIAVLYRPRREAFKVAAARLAVAA